MVDDRFSRPVTGVDTLLRDRPQEVEYFRAIEAARQGGRERREPSGQRQARQPRPSPAPTATPAPEDEAPKVVGTKLDVRG